MQQLPKYLLLLIVLPLFVACGKDGPDLKAGFAAELPEAWQVGSFKLTASEDVGTKVEPVSQHRFVAKVSPREDLYERVATLLGRDVLKRVYKKGDDNEVHGIAAAVFTAGKWETHYQFEKAPFFGGGQSAKAFRDNHVVVGSSDYRALIKSAKTDLENLQAQSNQLSGDLQKRMAELQSAIAESQERIKQSNETVARVQKESQERNTDLYKTYSDKTREINARYASEFNEGRNAVNGTYNKDKAPLDSQHTVNIQKIRDERQKIGQWRQAELKRVQDEYNATLSQARQQRLDSTAVTAVRNNADAKARTERAAIEEQVRKRMDESRELENKAVTDYRAELARMQGETKKATDALTSDVSGRRDADLAKSKEEYDTMLAAASTELKDARAAHNTLAQGLNERQRQLSNEINGLRNQLNSQNQNILNLQQVLAFFENPQE